MLFRKKFRIRVKGNQANLDKFSDAAKKAIKENRGWFGYVLKYTDSDESCKILHDMVSDYSPRLKAGGSYLRESH